MTRRNTTGLLVWMLSLMLIMALSVPAASAADKAVELRYSTFFPPTHGHAILSDQWAKEVEKRTNGAVKVVMFPGATLTPADQTYDGVVKGIADVGMSVVSYVKGRFPFTEVIDLPLGYSRGYQATRLANACLQKFKPKEYDDVKIMYFHAHGPGVFHSKKPLAKLDDLKGLKIRCSGTSAKVVSALGATPVAMPQTETYDALSKGVVDGVVSPVEVLKGWKFAEVVKNTTLNFGSSYSLSFFVVMNKKKWESLSKEAQATIEQINKEWIEKTGKSWDEFDKVGTEFAKGQGVVFANLTKDEDAKWAEKVKPVMDEYVKAMKEKNLPGEEALKFCREWLKSNP
ncbi:MAG: TRAP transporter substrate-binding protein [Thermodesulfobacteriota bacterium]